MIDIGQIARVLYDNRAGKDYLTDRGKIRILVKNDIKVSQKTYSLQKAKIDKELKRLFDVSFEKQLNDPSNKELESIITKMDYITLLKKIMDGEPNGRRTPSYQDKLQAGKQACEFFGWKMPEKIAHTDIEGKNIVMQGNKVVFTVDLSSSI